MSNSSIEIMQGHNTAIIPKWIDSLLKKTFFGKCSAHDDMQKNELNRYCITCEARACKYCVVDHHEEHKTLTIYRHVYQDVVPLSEMESVIDCDKVQPYKCNKKWVVSLTPLPHNGSGLLIEGDGPCSVCKRKLTDPEQYRFCSIECKVKAISVKGQSTKDEAGKDEAEAEKSETLTSHRKRSRKGVPQRAPLF